MIPRKKRLRYKKLASKIALDQGLPIPQEWEQVWSLLDQFPNEKLNNPYFVYLISDKYRKVVKIGKSKNVGARLTSLNTGNPNVLHILAYCLEKSPFTEKELHERFKSSRVQGEWFTWTPELADLMVEMHKQSKTQYRP